MQVNGSENFRESSMVKVNCAVRVDEVFPLVVMIFWPCSELVILFLKWLYTAISIIDRSDPVSIKNREEFVSLKSFRGITGNPSILIK